ncbi:MAG TPA: hypothetical protein PKX87_05125 [Alphaproteobacteria bacterium]|nr:hypothetical protein [Alphaproteobacteria bacterium]
MYSLEKPFLDQRVIRILGAQFGFAADPHPSNAWSAALGQRLLAAQLDVEGHGDLAQALRGDLERDDPSP